MVPAEYSPRTPTISGRAFASVATSTPAPMVATSATAILTDINLSIFATATRLRP